MGVQKYDDFHWKSLRNQNTVTKQMKNERVLKVTEKYNEKCMFLMKFRKEWNTHCQRIKMNKITKKEENLEVNEIKEENGKITKNTRRETLFDDQKIKLKSGHNHKINEPL